ncbi:peptidoglycan-binding protein [Actinoplanes sp. NPDC051861]|uniref:CIS tube protein n=1 Tax=Actinoplanes sp. NPDC051861 TaxID=3155170 RepID=UPI003436D8D8
MPLVQAVIMVLDWKPSSMRRGLPPAFPVQFNPTELSVAKGSQFADIAIPGLDSPLVQFVHGQAERLTVELFYDTTDLAAGPVALDVRTMTVPLHQLVKVQPATHAPPRVRFVWGPQLFFNGVVEDVKEQFTLFAESGIPMRATVTVTFRESWTLEEQLSDLNLMSSDHTKRHVVRNGETLSSIAAAEYGDPAQWRVLADANPDVVPDVRRLTPGVTLEIPPLDPVTGGAAT